MGALIQKRMSNNAFSLDHQKTQRPTIPKNNTNFVLSFRDIKN